MNEKIKEILVLKNLSASRFADEIGVQRSSISHILSGRNKPSFDLIQKIIRRFPDLGMEWIMEGTPVSSPVPTSIKVKKSRPATPASDSAPTEPPIPTSLTLPSDTSRQIEKILIFYTDKTFTEYKPS